MLAYEEINDDCHRCIGELIHENLRLFEEVDNTSNTKGSMNIFEHDREEDAGHNDYNNDVTSMNELMSESESTSDKKEEPVRFLGNFMKGFFFGSACQNSRKKMRNEIEIEN